MSEEERKQQALITFRKKLLEHREMETKVKATIII
jgi:hypothetical protein